MLKVSEILKVKGDILYTASPDTLVREAIAVMSEQNIGSLVIMEHGELEGMLTFREVIRHLHEKKDNAGSYTVRSIMDDAAVRVTPSTGAHEVQRRMLDEHTRAMPARAGPGVQGHIS